MGKQGYHIFLLNLLFIHICHSFPQLQKKPLDIFVLDGKKDCQLTLDAELLNLYPCQQFLVPFSEDYFAQRDIMPCVGIYDALYNLCKFPVDTINLKVPLTIDSANFCSEAKKVFHDLNFTYKGDEMKKWSNALRKTMQDEKLCNNLCIAGREINGQCITMLTYSNEFLRLNNTFQEKNKVNKTKAESEKTDIIPTKQITEGSSKLLGNSDIAINSAVNTSIKNVTTSNTKINQNPVVPRGEDLNKSDTSKDETTSTPDTNYALPINLPKDSNALKTTNTTKNTNIPTKTTSVSHNVPDTHIQKVAAPKTTEDEIINEETSTSQTNEMMQTEDNNDKADQKEKEVHKFSILMSSPFPITLKIQSAKSTPFLSPHEEPEKQHEEEKPPVDTDPVPPIYPGMSINPLKNTYAESEESYSFTYIVTTMAALCMVYMLFHYRNKLLALALEGRKGRNGRSRGRPSSANYTKLHHSNLEEAIASSVTAPTATHVLY